MASFSRLVQRRSSECCSNEQHIALHLVLTPCWETGKDVVPTFGAHTLLATWQGCGTTITGAHTALLRERCGIGKGLKTGSFKAGGLRKGISLSLGNLYRPNFAVSSRTNGRTEGSANSPEVSFQLRCPLDNRVDSAVSHSLPSTTSPSRPPEAMLKFSSKFSPNLVRISPQKLKALNLPKPNMSGDLILKPLGQYLKPFGHKSTQPLTFCIYKTKLERKPTHITSGTPGYYPGSRENG
jgi:hypothetical protein